MLTSQGPFVVSEAYSPYLSGDLLSPPAMSGHRSRWHTSLAHPAARPGAVLDHYRKLLRSPEFGLGGEFENTIKAFALPKCVRPEFCCLASLFHKGF